jgi:hypothetical protein
MEHGKHNLEYKSIDLHARPRRLVKIAVALNIVSAAADLILGVLTGVFVWSFPANLPNRDNVMISGAFMGTLFLAMAVVKMIGTIKVIRRRQSAADWGLATGIVGCFGIMMVCLGIVSVGTGIFAIVVFVKTPVKEYLADESRVSGAAKAQ